jgi:outer membrane murein-binding lipoprotein Lpp
MSTSSKAADILLETGSSFKRIAELTMELVDPNSSNRLSNSSSSSSQKIAIDSSELKRLRDALNRFSSDLDAVSQRIHANREAATAPQEVERLMSLNLTENYNEQQNKIEDNNEQQTKIEDIPVSNDDQIDIPMTMS